MFKLLVNAPWGEQRIEYVEQTGSYFDPSLVLWDERVDGQLPQITLGKMSRVDNQLVTLANTIPAHAAYIKSKSVPKSIGLTYGIEAMINAGVHTQVDTYIKTLSAVDQMYWQRSTTINRNHNLVEQVRAAMGWTNDYVDDLFIAAEQIFKQRTGLA